MPRRGTAIALEISELTGANAVARRTPRTPQEFTSGYGSFFVRTTWVPGQLEARLLDKRVARISGQKETLQRHRCIRAP